MSSPTSWPPTHSDPDDPRRDSRHDPPLILVNDAPTPPSSLENPEIVPQVGFDAPTQINDYTHGQNLNAHDPRIHSDWSDSRRILPDTFTCLIHLTLDGDPVGSPEPFSVSWKGSTAYKSAYALIAQASIRRLQSDSCLGSRHPYLKHGSCWSVVDQRVNNRQRLENTGDWEDVLAILVNEYTALSFVEGFRIEIMREYEAIQIHPDESESYYQLMARQLQSKMKRNFQGSDYIPRIDLINITTNDNIRRAIENHDSFLRMHCDKESFIEQVQRRAPKLLAMCALFDIDLKRLKLLLERGIDDSALPLKQENCPHHHDSAFAFRNFMMIQGPFLTYHFRTEGGHAILHPSIVVPALFSPTEDRIGGGGFGSVYKARIDPDHLSFAKDKKQLFAIKDFRQHSDIEKDFQREQGMLQELRKYPHRHIVVHLASWIQGEKYYIVFPLASCNLRQYMARIPEPVLEKHFVLWILRQFYGLADAIRHVHNLRDDEAETNQHLLATPQPSVQQGYHHDIKPENILFFESRTPKNDIFKITDFGLGKVHSFRSGVRPDVSRQTGKKNAQPTYESPDAYGTGFHSRPADLWSLGCVFLELLVWIFVPSEPVAGKFGDARLEMPFPRDLVPVEDDAFWSIDSQRNPRLRKGVIQWLDRVESLSADKRAFKRMVECTRRCLEPNKQRRVTAINLTNDIDAIVQQAVSDLEGRPNLYLNPDSTFPTENMRPILHSSPPSPDMGAFPIPESQEFVPPHMIVDSNFNGTASTAQDESSNVASRSLAHYLSHQLASHRRQPSNRNSLIPRTVSPTSRGHSRDNSGASLAATNGSIYEELDQTTSINDTFGS